MINVRRLMGLVTINPMITRKALTQKLYPPTACARRIRNDFYRAQATLKGKMFVQKDGKTVRYCTCEYAAENNLKPDVEVVSRDRKESKDPAIILSRWLDRIMIPTN